MLKSSFEYFENGRNTHKSWARQTDFLIKIMKSKFGRVEVTQKNNLENDLEFGSCFEKQNPK